MMHMQVRIGRVSLFTKLEHKLKGILSVKTAVERIYQLLLCKHIENRKTYLA